MEKKTGSLVVSLGEYDSVALITADGERIVVQARSRSKSQCKVRLTAPLSVRIEAIVKG